MTRHEIEFEPLGGPGHWASIDRVLLRPPDSGRPVPASIIYVDSTGESRLTYRGPLLPGPHALVALAPHAHREPGMLRVQDGDEFIIFRHRYVLHLWGTEGADLKSLADLVDANA